MRSTKKLLTAVLVLAMTATTSIMLGGTGQAAAACAPAEHAGGDWPVYGGDRLNSRSQPDEDQISPTTVPLLSKAWAFTPHEAGGQGSIQSTPMVAEGCVYMTTSSGWIYALNADTGEQVWERDIADTVSGVCCGGTLFTPTAHDGTLYINVSSNPETSPDDQGPHVIAMDAHTGAIEWVSDSVATEPGAYTNSSAVYHDGMIWIGISQPEQDFTHIAGFAILDAENGDLLKRTRTIPQDQFEAGFSGGSIWSTASIDDDGYGYVTTGQPSPWRGQESEFVNAIVKFDFAKARDAQGDPVASAAITNPRFGEIVGAIKGTWDRGLDVDFAGSPTLYEDVNGQQMVAAFQKSGWLHGGHTRQMTHAWSTPLAPAGLALGNYSSAATDGKNIFAVGTYPGQMWSVDGSTGTPNWVMPFGTTIGGNPVAYANGVVYHADGKGFLNGFDSETGLQLLNRPMSADAGYPCVNIGGGVSIARNTVYAFCGERGAAFPFGPSDTESGWLIAYRLAS